jgi:hypothetical protein
MTDKPAAGDVDDPATERRHMIPGAYEQITRMGRQPGSMGGGLFGAGDVSSDTSTMSAATVEDRQREGGGLLDWRTRRAAVGSR